MLTSPEWNEKLEKAYEDYYGKAWEKGEFESAAYEWIAGFLGNVNYTFTSASKMATGIASGAAGNMGLFVFSKLRKVDEADRGKLTVVQFENDVDGFSGFMYPIYATVCKDTECPYTALFINYLLSEEASRAKEAGTPVRAITLRTPPSRSRKALRTSRLSIGRMAGCSGSSTTSTSTTSTCMSSSRPASADHRI